MKPCWVVIEEDMGIGESIIGVYLTLYQANDKANESGRWRVEESELHDKKGATND